ncbi:MAG: cupredoxin domain-containing protein [Meiothermus sp.]|nr:cupredoxin domain-containing protein [Meiothermus sp.]
MRLASIIPLAFLAACGSTPSPATPSGNCTVVRMVSVQGGFSPSQITLKPGGCVEFRNDDTNSVHDATFPGNSGLNTQIIPPGGGKRVVLTLAGTYDYVCSVGSHAATMRGTIRVQ